MKCPSDHGQDETKNQICANKLGVSSLNSSKAELSERAGPGGGESGFHPDGEREPWQPTRILSGETWILRAWSKRHAGRRGEQDSEQDDDDGISPSDL